MNHQGVEPPGIAVRIGLLRAEQPVSGVAQTGYNVSVFIQVIVQVCKGIPDRAPANFFHLYLRPGQVFCCSGMCIFRLLP